MATRKSNNLKNATLFGVFCACLVFSAGSAYALFISNTVTIIGASMTTAGTLSPTSPIVRLFAVADNEFKEEDPQDNFGTDKDADVTSKENENTRLGVRFDLGALPADITINSCRLNLFMTDAPAFNSRQYGAYRLVDHEAEWGEGVGDGDEALNGESSWQWFARSGQWGQAGSDIASTPTDIINTGTKDSLWQTWNLTPDCDLPNQRSWTIKDLAENETRSADAEFETKESNHLDRRPYLAVDFSGGTFSTDHIVINEVLTDTDDHGHDRDNEWVELFNPTSSTVDISGWQICEEEGCSAIPGPTLIQPQGFVVLTPETETWKFWSVDSSERVVLGERFGDDSLDNDGDRLILRNAANAVVDQLSYEEDLSVFDPSIPGAPTDWSINRLINGYDTDRYIDFWINPEPTPGS